MSCESIHDRVCLKNNYIKFNNDFDYNIVFYSDDPNNVNCLSSINLGTNYDSLYYGSSITPEIINTIQRATTWGKPRIENINSTSLSLDTFKWKIKASTLNENTYNNCPVEQNDIVYFYKSAGPLHDIILCVVKSSINGNDRYDIGYIQVDKNQHRFDIVSSVRNNIYKDFKIKDLYNFNDYIMISNTDTSNRYFKLEILKCKK